MSHLYLDHNASSPLLEPVRRRLHELIDDPPSNPGGLHWHGQRARAVVERSRRTLAASLGRTDGRIVFTSGATEATNLWVHALPPGSRVAVSPLEHVSVLAPLQARADLTLTPIGHDERGRIDLPALLELVVSGGVDAVTLAAANNELGNLNPVPEVAAACAGGGVQLHVDAAQVVGRLPFEAVAGVSAVTVSAHKAGGPVGVGALWFAPNVRVAPVQVGGSQERGLRAGTEDVFAIAGLGTLLENVDASRWTCLAGVRDRLQDGLLAALGGWANGDVERRLPNTLHLSLPDRDSEEIVMALDLDEISISAGSACTAGSTERSHVVRALGWPEGRARGAIRISLGPEHQSMDVDDVVQRFVEALN